MKKTFRVIIAFLLFATATNTFAGELVPITGILRTTPSAPVVRTDSVEIYVNTAPNVIDYNVRNLISLNFDNNTDTFLVNYTTVRVKLSIFRKDSSNTTMSAETADLTVSTNNRYLRQNVDKDLLRLTDGYRVIVRIDSIFINNVATNTLPRFVYIESEIGMARYYNFGLVAGTPISGFLLDSLDTDCDPDAVKDELLITWTNMIGAEEYQVEWTYINNYGVSPGTYIAASSLKANFKNNSTRITVTNSEVRISLAYERGYIAVRVRAVGRDPLNPEIYVYGVWSTAHDATLSSIGSEEIYYNWREHEKPKNWQYSATFAEEGKKKEVISYFDGSLHNRQSVTKINSDQNVIVGQTIYDYQGRPAVNVLPVPVNFTECESSYNAPALKFYPRFNLDTIDSTYTKLNFDLDFDGECESSASPMDTTSGASQYYSNNNPDKSYFQAFLPDAEMFPFSQVEYTPDNTGRIRSQSGVGKEFRLGQGHETKYLYGQPNQLQLDRLFGSEAGDASHYKKNVVFDANGQASISYLNQEGKTIATSLAGDPPLDTTDTYLSQITSALNAQDSLTVDLFNKDAEGVSLVNKITPLKDGIEFSTQLLVSYTSTYDFHYDLQVDTLADSCLLDNICLSCVYDLTIKITNECGEDLTVMGTVDSLPVNRMTGHFNVIDPSPYYEFSMACFSPTTATDTAVISLDLTPGVYTVSKILTVNKEAIDFYVTNYMDTTYNSCVMTLDDFIDDAMASLDTSDCHPTCETCVEDLGTRDEFVASGKGTEVQYDLLVEQCLAPCKDRTLCDNAFEMMLLDMSPGGQYGGYDAATGTSNEALSVFNTGNSFNPNLYNGGNSHWKKPHLKLNGYTYDLYMEDDGTRKKVFVEDDPASTNYLPPVDDVSKVYTEASGDQYTYPENLTNLSDFIPVWNPHFARSLVIYHPEYAYYIACSQHAVTYSGDTLSSDNFDSLLVATETFEDAVENGFILANYDSVGLSPNAKVPAFFSNGAHRYDPFFTNGSYHLSLMMPTGYNLPFQAIKIHDAMEDKFNSFASINSISYTMVETAAILARCGNDFAAMPDPDCIAFGTDRFVSSTANDSVRDMEWRFLKNFYLSEKRKIQYDRMEFYAKYYNWTSNSWYGGCNICIGNSTLSAGPGGINSPYLMGWTPASPLFVPRQPCNIATKNYYSSAQKRFISPSNTGLSPGSVPYQTYLATGQCPITFQLQQFLASMAQGELLTDTVNMNTVSAFTPDMYNVLNNGVVPTTFINYRWQKKSVVADVLTAYFINPLTSAIVDSLKLDISATAISSFDSIVSIQNLTFDNLSSGIYSFNASATYISGGSLVQANITGSTGFNIKDCLFEPVCTPNQFAADIQDLFTIMALTGNLKTTAYNISADTLVEPLITATIKNMLGSPNNNLRWNYTAPNKFEIYDNANSTTRLFFGFVLATPSISYIDSAAYFVDIRSEYNNLFKMNGVDTLGNIAVVLHGKAEKRTSTDTVGISMGECGLPEAPDCNMTEHQIRKDLEATLNEFLSSTSYDGTVNLFENVNFSLLLQSYLPSSVTSTTSTWDYDTTNLASHDTLIFDTDEACTFELYRHISDPGAHNVNFSDIIAVTNLTGVPPMDEMGNYHDFYFVATFDSAGTYYNDTVRGTSCWPIKNCNHCDSNTVAPSAIDSTTAYIPTTYSGWSSLTLLPQFEITDSSECPYWYSLMNDSIVSYNNSVYANYHNHSLDTNMFASYQEFYDAGYCTCAKLYGGGYLADYTSADTSSTLPLPVDIFNYLGCHQVQQGTDSCEVLYDNYVEAWTLFDSVTTIRSEYSSVPLIADSTFKNLYCYCANRFIANVAAILAGYYPDSTTVFQMTDIASLCMTAPCIPIAPDTAFVFPPYTGYVNPCVAQAINVAVQNATYEYNHYIDSMMTSIHSRYMEHCLGALEEFNYSYKDKEYHYTLYYYDQAGNLVKTIPPEGVELLDIDDCSDALEQQILADRSNNTHTVFTAHRMPTIYQYNSLNQLVYQAMPDHDRMELLDHTLPNGLHSELTINKTQFVSGGKGYLSGYITGAGSVIRGCIYTTNDGGNHWRMVNNTVGSDLNAIVFPHADTAFTGGKYGIILRSLDGGTTWDAVNTSPSQRYKGDVLAMSYRHGIRGVIGGTPDPVFAKSLLYTTDGVTYNYATTGPTSTDTVTSITNDGTNYYATVKNNGEGKLYKSTDNGVNWTQQQTIRANKLNKVQYVKVASGVLAFAVGEDGTLLRSDMTSNTSWTLIQTNVSNHFKDVYFKNANEGVAIIDSVSGMGQVWKTFDGGKSWELLSTPGYYYNSLQNYDPVNHKLFACGDNGLIAKVLLNASPFYVLKLDKPSFVNDLKSADAVLYSGNPQAIAVGNNDTIYYSSNIGGSLVSWTKIKTTSFGVSGGDGSFKKVMIKDTTGNTLKGVLLTATGKFYTFYKNAADVFSFVQDSVTNLSYASIGSYFFSDVTMDNHSSDKFYAYDTISKRAFKAVITTTTTPRSSFRYMDTVTTQHSGVNSIASDYAANNFVMAGTKGIIKYKSNPNSTTTNYGTRTFTVKPVPLNAVTSTSSNTCYAAGEDGSVWNTNNGSTWRLLNSGTTRDMNAIKISNSSAGLIACDSGYAYRQVINDSLTITLSLKSTGTTEDLYSIALKDSNAYIGTSGGKIIRIPNITASSYNSVMVAGMTESFNAMAFKTGSSKVYAGGDHSAMYQVLGNSSARVHELYLPAIEANFATVNNGYFVSSRGDVRHTIDGGLTWEVVPFNTTVSQPHIHAVKADQAILMNGPAQAYAVNNLSTPVSISFPPVHATSIPLRIDFNQTGYGIMTGSYRDAYSVVASGSTFIIDSIGRAPAAPTATPNWAVYAVKVFSDSSFLMAGDQAQIYYYDGTFNAQKNYGTYADPISGTTFTDIWFHDDRTGYITGNKSLFLKCDLSSNIMSGPGAADNTIVWDTLRVTDPFYVVTSANKSSFTFNTIDFSDRYHGFIGGQKSSSPLKYAMLLEDHSSYYSTRFFYDKLGRMVVSQNSKQLNKSPETFSYTLYDALGRIKEVGEKSENTTNLDFREIFGSDVNGLFNNSTIDDDSLSAWIAGNGARKEVTKTYYDTVIFNSLPLVQDNLRKRVADVTYEDVYDGNDSTYQHATHYTYDIHGNVKTLLQDNPEISITDQRFKRTEYNYDLISGKVNRVTYERDSADMFIHKYEYDADNRITNVWTSPDNVIWQQDAKYFYYAHGPLARVEYGHDKVQGMDYAYTLQGWIKGVNSNTLKITRDMGLDGYNDTSNVNATIAKDVFGYTLGYYAGDYKAIDYVKWNPVVNRFEAKTVGSQMEDERYNLYNGNISHMATTLAATDSAGTGLANDQIAKPIAMAYQYDQLNRLKQSDGYSNIHIPNNLWSASGQAVTHLYKNTFSYDGNGNILFQDRYDASGIKIDNLAYQYHFDANDHLLRNRLYHVDDISHDTMHNNDVDDQGVFSSAELTINGNNNYIYDEIGNMIADSTEEIDTILWTVYGKIKHISRVSGSSRKNMTFDYDASGNRIAKHLLSSSNVWVSSEYYTRDAQGNILTVYKQAIVDSAMSFELKEQHLYGSSRVGMTKPELEMIGATTDTVNYSHIMGKKVFEGVNHLSNVLTTFTDRKVAADTNSDATIDFRVADVLSNTDYYPFGWVLPKRMCVTDTTAGLDTLESETSFEAIKDATYDVGEDDIRVDHAEPRSEGWGISWGSHSLTTDVQYHIHFYVDMGSCAGNTIRVRIRDSSGNVVDSMDVTASGYYDLDFMPAYNDTYTVEFVKFGTASCTFKISHLYISFDIEVITVTCPENDPWYRAGFNGMEKDDEVAGDNNSYTAQFWQYDPRLGRRWNLDPKPTFGVSDYATFANSPIWFNDVKGDTLSWNLFNPFQIDDFNRIANSFIKKQTSDGIYAVFSHGTKWSLLPSIAPRLGSPKSVIDYLSKTSKQFDKDMKAGKPITLILYSCDAAEGDNSLAERISKEYANITVVAADAPVYYGEKEKNQNEPLPVGKGSGFVTLDDGKKVMKQITNIEKGTITRGKDEPIEIDKSKEDTNGGSGSAKSKSDNKTSKEKKGSSGGPSFK